MASNGTPQSMLYNNGYGQQDNTYRNRSNEQAYTNSGQPMNQNYIPQFMSSLYGTQQPGLGRYQPPTMSNPRTGAWNGDGGYAYNLPNNYGPYGGAWGGPDSGFQNYNQTTPQQAAAQNWNGQTGGGWPGQPAGPQSFVPQMQSPSPGRGGDPRTMGMTGMPPLTGGLSGAPMTNGPQSMAGPPMPQFQQLQQQLSGQQQTMANGGQLSPAQQQQYNAAMAQFAAQNGQAPVGSAASYNYNYSGGGSPFAAAIAAQHQQPVIPQLPTNS